MDQNNSLGVAMNRFAAILFAILGMVFVASGGIIHVPANQPTIQAGIEAAETGDVVLVAEGTYYENINFMGKAITVASRFYLDHRKKHVRRTIINGSQPAIPDSGSVVYFVSEEDTNSVLCGFTITGGTGTVSNLPGFPPMRMGGGIYCDISGAKIVQNRIINNNLDGIWVMGGGFYCGPPFIPTTSVLEGNEFENNNITGQYIATGGAVNFNAAGRITGNSIKRNQAFSYGAAAAGGGIAISSWSPEPVYDVVVKGNTVTHNKVIQAATGMPGIGSHAGGLTIIGSRGIISNNVFMHNEACAVDSGFGAGVVLDFPPDELYFRNNIVAENYYSGTGNCFGGGFAIWDGNPTLESNLIEKNRATYGGGGWIGNAFSFANLTNNTIVKNHATVKGGAIHTTSAEPTVMNSILWNNKAPEESEIFVENGTIHVSYSDVDGGWPGTGNLDVNPHLISVLGLLRFRSPCIDAGNPDPMYNDPESMFSPGHAQLPARGTIRNDMGAYGGPYAVGWWNFFDFTKEVQTIEDEQQEVLAENRQKDFQVSSYPNPFNNQTAISFDLQFDDFVSLKIYNVLGQEVASLVSGKLQAGSHRYAWNATRVASGIYFYRLEVNGKMYQKKLILMK
jgi:hypothetical protein